MNMTKIVIVIVLYNCQIRKSKTVNSLINSYKKFLLKNTKNPNNKIDLIIYDNGKKKSVYQGLKKLINTIYLHNPRNPGLAKAYNYALKYCENNGSEWLILFDQDSTLPLNYFDQLDCEISKSSNSCVAIVPKVLSNKLILSPCKVYFGGTLRPLSKNYYGKNKEEVFAIGSGAIISVTYLIGINGFNELFWMDSLDRWLFHTIRKDKYNIWISNITLKHELSITNYDKYISPDRYLNIMKYEAIFIRNYRNKFELYFYKIRLLKRIFFLLFTVKNKSFAYMTFNHLIGRSEF